MNTLETRSEYSQFIPQKLLIYFRGLIMLILGGIISIASIMVPGVYILSGAYAWLPIAALVLVVVGVLECYDTYVSRNSERFIVNLQLAIMDTVFGTIVLFELSHDTYKMSVLIAAFLIAKGVFRVIAASAGQFPNSKSTILGGMISSLLGLLLWIQWPFTSIGFISFCLSIEIALRGWALIRFAAWLGEVKKTQIGNNP